VLNVKIARVNGSAPAVRPKRLIRMSFGIFARRSTSRRADALGSRPAAGSQRDGVKEILSAN